MAANNRSFAAMRLTGGLSLTGSMTVKCFCFLKYFYEKIKKKKKNRPRRGKTCLHCQKYRTGLSFMFHLLIIRVQKNVSAKMYCDYERIRNRQVDLIRIKVVAG